MSDQKFQECFEKIRALVENFKSQESYYLSPTYNEKAAREDFINKFWIALGWDVNHDTERNPYEQEVKVEWGIGSSQKRADYAFYVKPNFRDVRFYVEAKKPRCQVESAINYFQVIRYAWSSGIPLSVITDFEQFHVIDCRYRPDIETAIERGIKELKFHYSEYLNEEKFAKIYYLFSRDAVANGSLEKYAETLRKPRGKAVQKELFKRGDQTIDEAFLEELESYREELAKTFKRKNPDLDGETLTEITQRTLDRLVFIRFLEDKMIEPKAIISELGEKGTAWQDFVAQSHRLDGIYNGIVFKKHTILDSKDFKVDDDVFAGICEELCDKNSPYDFNAIPIHILGSIYERFLGKVIRTTNKQAKIEEKPEVRKAGGVYYTPDYIVRYIVENTVGKMTERKTPQQIAEMRFADIACGSGSFLLGVYDCLLKCHTRYYNEKPDKIKKGDCDKKTDGAWHLTLKKRREILLNNIYGVDIDAQAVEVTQLSLYLKLLEEENIASSHDYQLEFHETLLPSLNQNIVCGNSLIGIDISDGQLFESEEEKKLNSMNFEDRFPEIMKRGGFDVIVGNPPYGNLSSDSSLIYLENRYINETGTSDFYALFIARCLKLLKKSGVIGYIVPSAWLGGPAYEKFRSFCLNYTISEIINLPFNIFKDAYVDTLILILQADTPNSSHKSKTFSFFKKAKIELLDLQQALFQSVSQQRWMNTKDKKIVLDSGNLELIENLRERISSTFEDFVEIKRGVLFKKELLTDKISSANSYPYFEGDIYRYELNYFAPQWIEFNDQMDERPKELKWFKEERILLRRLVNRKQRLMAVLTDKTFITNKNLYSVRFKNSSIPKYILGLLNSRLLSKLYISQISQATKDDFPQVTIKDILALPCPLADKPISDKMVILVEQMLEAKKQFAEAKIDKEKDRLNYKCESVDRQIDKLVYELYGLTEEEIKIVEEATGEEVIMKEENLIPLFPAGRLLRHFRKSERFLAMTRMGK